MYRATWRYTTCAFRGGHWDDYLRGSWGLTQQHLTLMGAAVFVGGSTIVGALTTPIRIFVIDLPLWYKSGAERLQGKGRGWDVALTSLMLAGDVYGLYKMGTRSRAQETETVHTTQTNRDLFAFGNKTQPRPPRPDIDVYPDSSGTIRAQNPPLPHGASTFGNVSEAPLTGNYHLLPEGTQLPDGLAVVADGIDVVPDSPHPSTHHTIYPTQDMDINDFMKLFLDLPWEYAGKK